MLDREDIRLEQSTVDHRVGIDYLPEVRNILHY